MLLNYRSHTQHIPRLFFCHLLSVLITGLLRSASAEEAGGDAVEEYVNEKFNYKIKYPSYVNSVHAVVYIIRLHYA